MTGYVALEIMCPAVSLTCRIRRYYDKETKEKPAERQLCPQNECKEVRNNVKMRRYKFRSLFSTAFHHPFIQTGAW